jgi:cytoskeletal protein CcmA (bactofilin family)
MSKLIEPAHLSESTVNLIAEGTRLEGKVVFDRVTRFHGVVRGEIEAKEGSLLILGETCVIQGDVRADTVLIDGYVSGKVIARTKVVVSATGRVIGDIDTPSLKLEFGSHFEGRCRMEPATAT